MKEGINDYLWNHPRYPVQIIPESERMPWEDIRYASFGSSVTYGVGLGNRDTEQYSRKLSPQHGHNFGLRATGPNYPASCIYSMIGDNEYDVIILEYFMRGPEGLRSFALRIRERFPNAIIFMTKLWGPYHYLHKGTRMSLTEWAFSQGFDKGYIHDPNFAQAFAEYNGEEKFYDYYGDPHSRQSMYHAAVAKEIGAHVIRMAHNDYAFGDVGWIQQGHHLLAHDSFHLSERGHENLAGQMRDIIDQIGVPKNRVLGQFRGKDFCHNWFESGTIDDDSMMEVSPNGAIRQMPNTNKFVLSFQSDPWHNELGNGWIKISNPSSDIMDLFVAYMTTGPAPSKYPTVLVPRQNRDGDTFTLDPNAIGFPADMNVHIARFAHLGRIYPNIIDEYINFQPTETTERPFSLLAIIITPINDNNPEETFNGLGGGSLPDR